MTPLPGSLSDGSRPNSPLSGGSHYSASHYSLFSSCCECNRLTASPLSTSLGDLRADIKRIADPYFATGSPASVFLNSYVHGEKSLPITTSGVKGLPIVLRRGVTAKVDSKPSLLFLDLPVPPAKSGEPIPERFGSNVLLKRLEGMRSQDLPVFGVSGTFLAVVVHVIIYCQHHHIVFPYTNTSYITFNCLSGCGKTRSVIEMLCLQWGFYFNAAKSDLGSNDLSQLADYIDAKTTEEQGPGQNTAVRFLSWT